MATVQSLPPFSVSAIWAADVLVVLAYAVVRSSLGVLGVLGVGGSDGGCGTVRLLFNPPASNYTPYITAVSWVSTVDKYDYKHS